MPSRLPSTLSAVLCLSIVSSAQAQTGTSEKVFIDVNAGLSRPASDGFDGGSSIVTDRLGGMEFDVTNDEVRTKYAMKRTPAFDVGGGYFVSPRFFIGAAVTYSRDEQPANLTVTLRHPEYHPTLTATTTTRPLEQSDTAVHFSIGYAMPLGRARVRLFGGPTRFSLTRELTGPPSFEERGTSAPPPVFMTYSLRSLTVNEVETVRGGAWGYHAGADVSYFFTPKVGVGALVRYSDATVRLENPVSSIRLTGYNWPLVKPERVPIDVGRLDVLAGLRLRF